MFTADSRYASQRSLVYLSPDGEQVHYVAPRILPPIHARQVALNHGATDSDRLDLLAYRYLGPSTAWWMIADANSAPHPAALPGAPGESVAIPVPGTGGTPG